jgi:hypothetical protein
MQMAHRDTGRVRRRELGAGAARDDTGQGHEYENVSHEFPPGNFVVARIVLARALTMPVGGLSGIIPRSFK